MKHDTYLCAGVDCWRGLKRFGIVEQGPACQTALARTIGPGDGHDTQVTLERLEKPGRLRMHLKLLYIKLVLGHII